MSSTLPDEASIAAASSTMPTPVQADTGAAVLSNPLDFPAGFRSTIEDWITLMLPSPSSIEQMVSRIAQPVGSSLFLTGVDLTANTSEYVYTHPATGLTYLYANGATVSQTTYADLFAWFGGHIWAADPGSGNFVLPDTRGRSLWTAGTNSATDIGDNDGVSESSRQPKHTHSDTLAGDSHTHGSGGLSVTGAPGVGSLALPNHVHTERVWTGVGGGTVSTQSVGSDGAEQDSINTGNPTTLPAISGAPSAGTLDVGGSTDGGTVNISGSVGSGMSGSDAVAHIVIGSLVIRF